MNRKSAACAATVSLVLLLASAGSDATTLRPIPFAQVARRADRIVVATVEGSSCRLGVTPAGRVRPYTDVEFGDVAEVAGSVVTRNLVLPVVGGMAGGRSLRVPGTPVLETGRRYVLFLKPEERLCGLVGWTQGVFRVERGPDGIDRVLTHDGDPVSSVAGGRLARDGPPLDLGAFLEAVRGLREEPPPPTEIEEGR